MNYDRDLGITVEGWRNQKIRRLNRKLQRVSATLPSGSKNGWVF